MGGGIQIRNTQPMISKKKKIVFFLEPSSMDNFLFYF